MKFVILAAGKGSRVGRAGENLHKALLPLDGMAILSHQLKLIPSYADIIVAVGYRAEQIKDYVRLAHPSRAKNITFITVPDWDKESGGPGASLLAVRDAVGDNDMVYVSCDTLWAHDPNMWLNPNSWAGVAPIPPGTPLSQWCRFTIFNDYITGMFDKTMDNPHSYAFVGLAHIHAEDLRKFWCAIEKTHHTSGETRDVVGLLPLINDRILHAHHVEWTDTGTESSYRNAVARVSGYDWTKLDQATYVIPDEGRVIKYMANPDHIERRYERGSHLKAVTPVCITRGSNMLAYTYHPGQSVYSALDMTRDSHVVDRLLDWYSRNLTSYVPGIDDTVMYDAAINFYQSKTEERITKLNGHLSIQALNAINNINWYQLVKGCWPVYGHGDFNFGNIITDDNGCVFTAIDWREDFAGELWIDARYDLAKLLAGTMVHWDNARRGDFRPWDDGQYYRGIIRRYIQSKFPHEVKNIEVIGALSLINSAPLHASPLDEILIARATYWLGQLL